MWKDPIVEEIRAIRRKHTDEFGGDVRAICEDLRKRERESAREFVTFADRPANPVIVPVPNATTSADAPANSPN